MRILHRPAARAKAIRYAVVGALAVTLATGCSSSGMSSRLASASQAGEAFRPARGLEPAVAQAEIAVARNPADPALRAALGQAYLAAGRFESALTAFNDALDLGDTGGRTALGLALASIGVGRPADAVALLDDWSDAIPAGDRGLALALAGETSRGVAILSSALRDGEATPKLRQNLAYAYALDGRWREARLMAAQDLPADQVDARLGEWASRARPEDSRARVAGLLDVKLRADPGLPRQLALALPDTGAQAAVETAALAPAAELPPVADALPDDGPSRPAVAVAVTAPPSPAVVAAAPAPTVRFDAAFARPAQPVRDAARPARAVAPRAAAASQPARAGGATASATHLVQLGSFSTPQGARRAWGIVAARNPELRGYRMTVTQAVVRGRTYWRVAAAGFDAASAAGTCSAVRQRGGACFAYAATRTPAPGGGAAGPQRARR